MAEGPVRKGGGRFFGNTRRRGTGDTIQSAALGSELSGFVAPGAQPSESTEAPESQAVTDDGAPSANAKAAPASGNDGSAPDRNGADAPPFEDPILAAGGRSLQLNSLFDFEWPSGNAYLSANVRRLLLDTIARFAPDGDGIYQMGVDHFVPALIAEDAPVLNMFIGQLRDWAQSVRPEALADVPPVRPQGGVTGIVRDSVVLRWDMVELLAEASKLRARTNPSDEEIGTRHLAVALLTTRSGQGALANMGLLDKGFAKLTDLFATQLKEAKFGPLGDQREAWLDIAMELGKQPLQVSLQVDTRVSYDADRACRLVTDALGVREDAAALSDLILLEAATPPLAIGLFGAWGSGKSTLIKELQHRIHEDLKQEQGLAAAGLNDNDARTRRVRNVVQIEFNAWAYADSANLWASLTSEIFDQLAAGGIRPEGEPANADRIYAEIVRDVRLLNSNDAIALRKSGVEIAELEQQKQVARSNLESAREARKSAVADAVANTLQALKIDAPDGGPNEVYVHHGAPPPQPEKDGLTIAREVLGASGDPEARIAAYAEAGGATLGLLRMVWDFARRRWRIAIGFAIAIAAAILLFVLYPPSTSAGWFRWLGPAALSAAGILPFFVAIVLPAIRFFALLRRELNKSRTDAEQKESAACLELGKVEVTLETVRTEHQDVRTRMAKYGALATGANAASPEVMLEYLMSDSADVHALRGQQGLIARVRRCFEQLDSITKEMRKEPRSAKAIDRIVLYIDDLDRCDAAQVSNVMQAVHLLLAFECFVVIVAVDARWLKQSLETHHPQLRRGAAETGETTEPATPQGTGRAARKVSEPVPPNGFGEASEDEPPATAADYLEKIFQIPLWVRPLVDEDAPAETRYSGYERFIESIAKPVPAPAAAAAANPADPAAPAAVSPGGAATAGQFQWVDPKRPEQSDKPRRQGLRLTDPELKVMKALGPLAAKSPRAVKKMINLYRLIRVRYRDDALTAFLANGASGVPSYRELLFALACENGLSGATRRKLRDSLAAMSHPSQASWPLSNLTKFATVREGKLIKAVTPELGGLTVTGMFTAMEEVRRYSFVP